MQYKPVLKWAGGKNKISEIILSLFPSKINNYFEPFLGGGAISLKVFKYFECKLFLSDNNKDLIDFYKSFYRYQDLYTEISKIQKEFNGTKENYIELRNEFNMRNSDIRKSAIFYFLNKTSFNGLVRYNSKGKYNVPFGKRDFKIEKEKLFKFSQFVKNNRINIQNVDFKEIKPCNKDLVYLDPPYHPLNKTSSFTSYSKGWNETNEMELYYICNKWNEKNIKFILSNNDVPFIRNLFKHYKIKELLATKCIGASCKSRRKTSEIIIYNF